MKAMIWKELRENGQWALLAMLALGGIEVYAMHQTDSQSSIFGRHANGITLCNESFLLVTTFGCALIGFALGLLQILPELPRDRWATLIHRPVSKGTLFLAKVVSGLLLYAVAAIAPFLFCVWLAATPGHFAAPFVPGLALAGTADVCIGIAYYLAALIIALNRTGWKILAILPLVAAMYLTLVQPWTHNFPDIMTIAAFIIAVLGCAAWGAFLHPASFVRRPGVAKAAILAVAYFGACRLPELIQLPQRAFSSARVPLSAYELTDKGIPLKINYNSHGDVASVLQINGEAPQDRDLKADRVRNHIQYLNVCAMNIGDAHGWQLPRTWGSFGYRIASRYLLEDGWRNESQNWFYLAQQRVFVSVLVDRKAVNLRFDADGFRPASSTPAPFASDMTVEDLGDTWGLWDSNNVRLANLREQDVKTLLLPVPAPVYGVTTAWARSAGIPSNAVVAAMGTAVAVWDLKDEKLIATLPYPHAVDHWGNISVGINGAMDRFYLWQHPSAWISEKESREMPSYLDEMDEKGNVVKSYTIPNVTNPPNAKTWSATLSGWMESPVSVLVSPTQKNRLGGRQRIAADAAVGIMISSALFAGLALRSARKAQMPPRSAWRWAALVFAFNFPGFLMFRFAADWPGVIPCPQCGGGRSVEGIRCPHCGGEWPKVASTGAEIFEPLKPVVPH